MQLRRALAFLVSALLSPSVHPQAYLPKETRAALVVWRRQYGSNWQLIYDRVSGHGRMLFGGGAPAPFVPEGDADWFLAGRYFVILAARLLGVEQETLLRDRVIALPLSAVGTTDKVAVRFRQESQGVPVLAGWVDVLFEQGTATLLSIDSQALPGVAALDVTPTVEGRTARDLAAQTFLAETSAGSELARDPRLVVCARDAGGGRIPALAWEVAVSGNLPDGGEAAFSYLVAAQGEAVVLERKNCILQATPLRSQQGRALAHVTEDGCCFGTDDGTNRTRMGLANMTVLFADGSTALTDADGFFSAPSEPPENPVTLALSGPYLVVNNHVFWPEGDLLVQGALGRGLALIPMNPFPLERDVAQANAFYRIDQMRSWVQRVNPRDRTMDSSSATAPAPYRALANWVILRGGPGGPTPTAPCNAVFDGYAGVVKFSVSGEEFGQGCPNAAFAPVIWHEMGHWLNERYGSGNDRDGFAEGNADAFALYQMDRPTLTYGNLTRSGENAVRFCGDCESRQGCRNEPHEDGLPLMGALWKVRRNLEAELGAEWGAALADALFLGWMNAFDQGQIHSIIEWQWLVLDDDDHDVTNGAPHGSPIDAAFREQGFPGFDLPVTTVICR